MIPEQKNKKARKISGRAPWGTILYLHTPNGRVYYCAKTSVRGTQVDEIPVHGNSRPLVTNFGQGLEERRQKRKTTPKYGC